MQDLSGKKQMMLELPYDGGMPGGRPAQNKQPAFGKRLAQLRKGRGLTQAAFGKLVGLSQSMVVYYERRAQNPTAEFVVKAAEVLGVGVEELLGGPAKKTKKRQKPGPPSKLKKQIDEIHKLPRSKQRFVSELLDTVLKAND